LQASAKTLLTSSALYLAEGGVHREKELDKPIRGAIHCSQRRASKTLPFCAVPKDMKTLLNHG
jgi:hypothetical protein